ncbi:hypothetical protein Y032_0327g2586 [Ancylostoma ceylanicum]|uniref:Zinc finger, C4 type n=1 Tax=Ancylostoma ceylanicum TaxID=53326 RepID=A0A016RZP2_9BILA|nr:hypothetical protein Y032_0327g2586 [Ancylostoma ceylanicum]
MNSVVFIIQALDAPDNRFHFQAVSYSFVHLMISRNVCEICESPTARSVHFGARSCKACAAFFRRTVALNVVYECKEPQPCTIHYERRMSCKKCRYDKCIAARMSRELVRSTRGTEKTTRNSRESETRYEVTKLDPTEFTECATTSDSPSQDRNTEVPRIPIAADLEREGRRRVIDHYQRIEAYLNNRRRIMYTDAKMISVFTTMCECPYEKRHLKPLNYKEYAGNKRSDFIMLYDYAISVMQFDELEPPDKHILYRYVCGVDALLNSAYFTSRISFEDKWMVLNTCEYICVDPMPMTGDEPWAQHLFANSEDQAKYKSIVPQKVALWHSLIVPFHQLQLEFDEFCVLKALILWHISHYKLGESGRRICKTQRNLLINCLHDLAQERSRSPEEWVGNLILFISCVFQQMCELVNSLVMITFFDIVEYDAVVKEFFGFD